MLVHPLNFVLNEKALETRGHVSISHFITREDIKCESSTLLKILMCRKRFRPNKLFMGEMGLCLLTHLNDTPQTGC